MKITLRPARIEDFPFCFVLTKVNMQDSFEKNWGGWCNSVFKKHFSPAVSNVILRDGRQIGYFSLSRRDEYWCLDDIQLMESETGQGVGTVVIKRIEETVSASDLNKLHLTVFKDNPAMQLYDRLGFGVIKDKDNSVLMEKIIT